MWHNSRNDYTLRRNHSNALPRYLIAYAAETLPVKAYPSDLRRSHQFRTGYAISCRLGGVEPIAVKQHPINKPSEFWDLLGFLTGMRHTTWVVCHNCLFNMIVTGLPEKFELGELTIDWPRSKRKREDNMVDNSHQAGLCIIDSPPTIIAARMGSTQGRVVLVDLLNWFPGTISSLGTACGLEGIREPTQADDDLHWQRYCERKATITYQTFTTLIRWVKENDMGMFRYTAASQSMSAFRHSYMSHDICFHDLDHVKTLERRSYFGGRTEVYKLGEITETVYQLDSNSLFPSVMYTGLFPCELKRYETRFEYLAMLPSIDLSASIAEVELTTDKPLYPLRLEHYVVYPVGTFKTVLAGPELHHAQRMGHLKRIRSWSEYKLAPLFTLFVDSFWEKRQEYKRNGNKLYETFVKRLLNSLYGKFGQLSAEWINVPDTLAALPWSNWCHVDGVTGQHYNFRSFGWQIQRQSDKKEIDGNFPAISAFITSAARMRMNLVRQIAGWRNILYQGVDGLIVTRRGYTALAASNEISQTELGKLRLELQVNYGYIWGCNDYRLGGKVVLSGRASQVEELEGGQLLQRKFAAKDCLFNGLAISEVEERLQEWCRTGTYTKGIVQSDGWIEPLAVGDQPLPLDEGVNSEPAAASPSRSSADSSSISD